MPRLVAAPASAFPWCESTAGHVRQALLQGGMMHDVEILGRMYDRVYEKVQGAEGERRVRLVGLLAQIERRLHDAERLHWDGRQ